MKLTSLISIAAVMILMGGVFFGVTLVQTEQDIRNKADELKEHKVNVCHKTGSDSNPWVQIEVSENALEAHLTHGDIQGNCPSQKKNDDKDKEKEKDEAKDTPSTGGVTLASNVTVVNQTFTPAAVTPETKYVYITTKFDFWIKFQGIDERRPDKIVRVIFRKGEEELHVYNKVVVTSDSKGIYRGTITDVRPGVYEVLVKGDGFLQKKFVNINLARGANRYDWSKDPLLAGDFNSDNILDARDVSEFLSFYTDEINPVNGDNKVFDLDMNNFLNSTDLDLVLGNYNQLKLEGDN